MCLGVQHASVVPDLGPGGTKVNEILSSLEELYICKELSCPVDLREA